MPDLIRVALAGNPDSGKTSLFHALTRARQHVGNVRAVRRTPARGPSCPGCTVSRGAARTPGSLLILAAALLLPSAAVAADTVETGNAGAIDVDFYLGYDGAAGPAAGRTVYSDIMIGYGIVDRFSAYLGTTLAAQDSLAHGEPRLYLGLFGTIVDTDHVDFDLFLDVGAGGEDLSQFQVTPSTELNADVDPDLGSFGGYLRAGLVGYSDTASSGATFDLELNPGAYWTAARDHQLFVEYDMTVMRNGATEVGGLALGYNVVLNDTLELISQVHVDISQQGQTAAVSFMAGFIATLDRSATGRTARPRLAAAE